MRKRTYQVKCRMNQEEYDNYIRKLEASGQTHQAFLLNAIDQTVIASREETKELKEMNRHFSDLLRQIRGMGTNINQMAHMANATGRIPEEKVLKHMNIGLQGMKWECDGLWQSIRQLISRQRPMGQ